MRFLVVAQRFHTNLYYRVIALQNAGHFVKVIVLYKGKSEFYKDIDIQQIKFSGFSRFLLKTVSFFKKKTLKSSFELRVQSPGKELRGVFKEYKPDVILLKAYQNMLAIKTLTIARKHKAKVLMLTQTTLTKIKGSMFLFKLNIKLFKFLNVWAYITPIRSNFEAFKKIGITNVFYLPFVYPSEINKIPKTTEPIKLLSVGKFQKRKDQRALLKPFKRLITEGFNINLCLVGEVVNTKYIKSLYNFINENNLSEKFSLQTNVQYSQVVSLYNKYDLFLLPAYNEPAAYSIVEAMANGLPVICSNQNGTKCYIEKGKNGYIFEARNEADLYNKIKLIISDKENLIKMKKNALSSAKEKHSLISFEQNIIKIIKN